MQTHLAGTARWRSDEAGFTLIELMVVVLIIAILLAIAIPTFLGSRAKAQDRAAQSNLRNALTAEKTYYTDGQTYTTDASALKAVEPNLPWGTDPATELAVAQPSGVTDVVCLTRKSASGKMFSIFESGSVGVAYGTDDLSGGNCPATAPSSYKSTGW